ncbi:ankyrin repeat domain-containing protein [Nannocystis bainbridge]|uniref:Ankyrin repeat domain-containing protein n=1 Tax=Nannocystis bainbridge TaxID=2995303 RepID=A0ABT5DRH9_9BACT|nr:ankyrin repeat domain-containing protein [Nannocystis bainbridge]MDC0716262.1 ankyrin repeat domain-containing protein [Nannocystis bainbridge]
MKKTAKKTGAKTETTAKAKPAKATAKQAASSGARKGSTTRTGASAKKPAAAKRATAKKSASKTAAKKSSAKKTASKTAAKKTASKTAAKKASTTRPSKAPGAKKPAPAGKAANKPIPDSPSPASIKAAADNAAGHWKFIDAWFTDNDPGTDYRPDLPAKPKDASAALARWEQEFGESFEASLHVHFARGFAHPGRTFMEYTLLELRLAHDRWRGLNELVDEGAFARARPRALDKNDDQIQFVWWSRGFIPIAEDGGGNLICADMNPGPGGTRGQIIQWEKTEGPLGPLAETLGVYIADYRQALAEGSLAYDAYGTLERRKVRARGTNSQEALFAAVEAGDGAEVARLVAADKKLLAVRNQYDEPLIIPAIQQKHTEVVRAYLDAGVDANTRGPGGAILGYAISAASSGSVALLLQRGAVPRVDKQGAPEGIIADMLYGSNFSDHAPEADYVAMLDSLLAAGADPNVACYGETPLMKAAAFGSMTLVKRLLAAGARPDIVDDKGKNAAAYARSKRRKEVAEFLGGLAAR